jgi:hypothetical protein
VRVSTAPGVGQWAFCWGWGAGWPPVGLESSTMHALVRADQSQFAGSRALADQPGSVVVQCASSQGSPGRDRRLWPTVSR